MIDWVPAVKIFERGFQVLDAELRECQDLSGRVVDTQAFGEHVAEAKGKLLSLVY